MPAIETLYQSKISMITDEQTYEVNYKESSEVSDGIYLIYYGTVPIILCTKPGTYDGVTFEEGIYMIGEGESSEFGDCNITIDYQ